MDLPLVVIVFMALALLVSIGVMVLVALPNLRDAEDERRPADRRHSSRTRR
ncbi:hypothetical protein [Brachybacterium sp. UNK5269]|uniref:hypothetical protein n=1 Tax=Brachybacterium sp. UNK5269 TaxID=3408576 RepID=UPI003BAF69F8